MSHSHDQSSSSSSSSSSSYNPPNPLTRMPSVNPANWARATSVPTATALYTYPAAAMSVIPGSNAANLSNTTLAQQGRYSEPISLRGQTVFIRMVVIFNMGLWLIRDSSLSSFLLYSLFINAVLYFFILRGEPFNLALLIESTASVTAKNINNIPNAVQTAAINAAQQVHAMRQNQTNNYNNSSSSSSNNNVQKSSPTPVAFGFNNNNKQSNNTQPASASSSSSSSVAVSSPKIDQTTENNNKALNIPSPLSSSMDSSSMMPMTPSVEPVITPQPQPMDNNSNNNNNNAASSSSNENAAQLHLPTESTPVVIAGATARHSSHDAIMSWTRASGSSYDVRIGPNYKKYGKKAPSKEALFECVGVDVFGAPDGKIDHIAQYLQLPWIAKKTDNGSNKTGKNIDELTAASPTKPPDDAEPPHELDPVTKAIDHYEVDPAVLQVDEELGVPTLFIVNFQIPTYAPSYFGNREDGEGFSILLYYQITAAARAEIRSGHLSGAVQLFKEFVANAHAFEYHSRFKCIPRIVNPHEAKVGMATRQAMKMYNSKPFLTGPHCHSFIRGPGYMEADIDVHRFCLSARKGAFGTLDALNSLIVDVGFVIEGGRDGADNELPEQILACGRVAHLDPMHAKSLAYYIDIGKKERAKRLTAASGGK